VSDPQLHFNLHAASALPAGDILMRRRRRNKRRKRQKN